MASVGSQGDVVLVGGGGEIFFGGALKLWKGESRTSRRGIFLNFSPQNKQNYFLIVVP